MKSSLLPRLIVLLLFLVVIVSFVIAAMTYVRHARRIDVVVAVIDDETGRPVPNAKVILTATHINELDTNTRPRGFGALTNHDGIARLEGKAPFMVGRLGCEAAAPDKYGSAKVTDSQCVVRVKSIEGGGKERYSYDTFTGQFGYHLTFSEESVSGPSPGGSAN